MTDDVMERNLGPEPPRPLKRPGPVVFGLLVGTFVFSLGGWLLGTMVAGVVATPVLAGAFGAGLLNVVLNLTAMRVLA